MIKSDKQKRTFFFLLMLLVFSSIPYWNSGLKADTITGTVFPFRSEGELAFNIDMYRYDLPDSAVSLEVCYSLDLAQLSLETTPREDFSFTFDLTLINKKGKNVFNSVETKRISQGMDQSGAFQSFIDLVRLKVIPDSLNLVLTLSDSVSGRSGTVDQWIYLRPASGELALVSPMFITQLSRSQGAANVFTRHGFDMIPNPSRFYDASQGAEAFFIYLEINNLDYDPANASEYDVVCRVEDMAGNTVSQVDQKQLKKVSRNTSRIEKISLKNMPTGMYSVSIQVSEPDKGKSDQVKRYFTVYSGESKVQSVLPMDEASIKNYYDQIKYIATDKELEVFKNLDPAGMQEFLLGFWKSKDPTPATPVNEFMIHHFQRIEYCRQNFRNGINSDRGRIYVTYGPPVDIERSASTLRYSKPVEIWTYSLEGRIEFVFVDRTNDDSYVLMHSTHPDEINNPNWMNDFKMY